MIRKFQLIILASGNGSNAEAIMEWAKSSCMAEIIAVLSDKKDAPVLERARKFKIPNIILLEKNKNESREKYDQRLLMELKRFNPDLILLAGFMRILGTVLVEAYSRKIINIHPTLLPKYPGLNGYEEMFKSNDQDVGCTVHYVDEGVDTGEVIGFSKFHRRPDDTFLEFKERGLRNENQFYPKIIEEILNGKGGCHD